MGWICSLLALACGYKTRGRQKRASSLVGRVDAHFDFAHWGTEVTATELIAESHFCRSEETEMPKHFGLVPC